MFRFLSILVLGSLLVKFVLAIVRGISQGLAENKSVGESATQPSTTQQSSAVASSSNARASVLHRMWSVLKFLSIPAFVVYLLGFAFVHAVVSEGKDMWEAKLSAKYVGAKLEGSCDGFGTFKLSGVVPDAPVRLASMPENLVKIEMSAPSLSCVYFASFTAANRQLATEFIDTKLRTARTVHSEEFYDKADNKLEEMLQFKIDQRVSASQPAAVPDIPKPVSKQLLQQSISGQ